jgi:hypothetical protein
LQKSQAEHDHTVAMIQMVALGDFTAEKLGPQGRSLRPQRHYNQNRLRWIGLGGIKRQ